MLYLRALTGTGIIAAGLVAFFGSEHAANRSDRTDRVVVTYWEKWTTEEAAAMQKIVDKFNASQDHVFVRYLSISNIAEKTLLATAGGNPPDVSGMWCDQVVQYADANALTDITDLAAEAGIRESDYAPSCWNVMTYKGRLYALPTSAGSCAIYVNADLVPKRYATPESFPKTLSEFETLVDESTKKGANGRLQVAGFLPRSWFGSGVWNALFGLAYVQNGRMVVNGPENEKAWAWVSGFSKQYGRQETQSFMSGIGSAASSTNPFVTGKVATYIDGPWFSDFIHKYAPDSHWFAAPIPYPDGHHELKGFTMLCLNTLMIPKGCRHPKEAFEFVRFVQQQANMEQLCRDQHCNTPLSKASTTFVSTHPNKDIHVFEELMKSQNIIGPAKVGIYSQAMEEMGNAVDAIDLGRKTPHQALDDAQLRIDQIWAKYKRQVLNQ